MRAVRVGLGIALLLTLLPTFAVPALAGDTLFEFARLRGIPTGGLAVRNIPGGGVPWTLTRGEARLDEDGTLEVEVQGLVVAATGSNPAPQFMATLSP